MKKELIIALALVAAVGCKQNTDTTYEPTGATDSIRQQKEAVRDSEEAAKDRIDAEAKAKKQQVEAQSDAQKAALEARKEAVQAQDSIADKQNDAARKQADVNLLASLQKTLGINDPQSSQNKTISVAVNDGKVTVNGKVATEAEKNAIEAKIRAVSGVKDVDNDLDVQN